MEQHEKRTPEEREFLQLKSEVDGITRCCRLVFILWLIYGIFSLGILIHFLCTGSLLISRN